MIETPPRPPIRAIVASFLFTDLVDFSKGAASEQYVAKAALAASLRSNLAALRESDYWIKDTGDGALIAFINNPEHALYMALALAQDYAQAADGSEGPSHILRTGLHLGTVKETIDVEARRNYIGDGINATKRIMDFAAPGQIAASRNFFEAVANLDTEYAALFQHLGASDDKHGRAHELYAVAPSAEVLQKLRLDLTAAAPRSAEPAAKIVPAISVKRDAPAAAATESPKPPDRTPQTARRAFNPLVLLVGLVIVAAAIFWFTRGHERAPAPVAPVVGPVVAVPEPAKATDSSPRRVAEPTPPHCCRVPLDHAETGRAQAGRNRAPGEGCGHQQRGVAGGRSRKPADLERRRRPQDIRVAGTTRPRASCNRPRRNALQSHHGKGYTRRTAVGGRKKGAC